MSNYDYFSKNQEFVSKNFGYSMRNLNENSYNNHFNNKMMYSNYNNKMNFSSDESEEENDINELNSVSNKDNEEDEKIYNKKVRKRSSAISDDSKKDYPKVAEFDPNIKKICCTCEKSRCLKKYCDCFAANKYCEGCECKNCFNIPKFREMIKRSLGYSHLSAKKTPIKEEDDSHHSTDKVEVVCNCTKSNCTKKYCECYKNGEGCKDNCRCINCENNKMRKNSTNLPKNLNEELLIKRKDSKNFQNFIIEGTSVYICNEDISITQRKETPQKLIKMFKTDSDSKNNFINLNNLNNEKEENNLNSINLPKKNIFQVKPKQELVNNETPKSITKKRKRTNSKEEIINKSPGTHFQTPIFTTTNQKLNLDKKTEINNMDNIVKNLDKIY